MSFKYLTAAIASGSLVFCASSAACAADDPILISTAEDFITYATNGEDEEVRLTGPITLAQHVFVKETFDLDLNGFTINLGEYTLVSSGNLIVRDTSTAQTGAIRSTVDNVINVGSKTNTSATFTLESGKILGVDYGIRGYGTTTINGGTIEADCYAVYGTGSYTINGGLIKSSDIPTVSLIDNATMTMNGGEITTDGADQAVNLASGSSFVMNDGKITATNPGGSGIAAFRDTSTTINGGTITVDSLAYAGNGTVEENYPNCGINASLTITGGSLTANSTVAIYIPQKDGNTNISGGTITGKLGGIEVRAGNLNITGGTITSLTNEYRVKKDGNGTTTIGTAVAVAQHATKQTLNVHISGGVFNAYMPFSEANPENNPPEAIAKVKVIIDSENAVPQFNGTNPDASVYSENLTEFIYAGHYSVSPKAYINDTRCEKQGSISGVDVLINCEEPEVIVNPDTFDKVEYYFVAILIFCFMIFILTSFAATDRY